MVDFLAPIQTAVNLYHSITGDVPEGPRAPTPPHESAYEATRGSLRARIEAADEYGLHRTLAFGSPGSSGYGGAAAAPEAIRGHRGDPTASARARLIEAETGYMEAMEAEARSRTMLNVANYRRGALLAGVNRGGPTGMGRSIFGPVEANPFHPVQSRPHSVEPTRNMPAWQAVQLGDHLAVGPNPEAFEVGISELLAGAAIYGPQWAVSALENLLADDDRRRKYGREASDIEVDWLSP